MAGRWRYIFPISFTVAWLWLFSIPLLMELEYPSCGVFAQEDSGDAFEPCCMCEPTAWQAVMVWVLLPPALPGVLVGSMLYAVLPERPGSSAALVFGALAAISYCCTLYVAGRAIERRVASAT